MKTTEAAEPVAVTVQRGTELTGLSRNLIYNLIASGELRTAKVGRARVIDYASLKEAVTRRMAAAPVDPKTSEDFARRSRGAGRNGRPDSEA